MSDLSLAISISMIFIMMTMIASAMVLSNSMTILVLVSMVTMVSVWLKIFLMNEWSSILLFMALIGGLMILFSFFMSTLPKEKSTFNNSIKMWLILTPALFLIAGSWNSPQLKQVVSLYSMKTEIMIAIMIMLLVILMAVSKIIVNPNKPFKSIN